MLLLAALTAAGILSRVFPARLGRHPGAGEWNSGDMPTLTHARFHSIHAPSEHSLPVCRGCSRQMCLAPIKAADMFDTFKRQVTLYWLRGCASIYLNTHHRAALDICPSLSVWTCPQAGLGDRLAVMPILGVYTRWMDKALFEVQHREEHRGSRGCL